MFLPNPLPLAGRYRCRRFNAQVGGLPFGDTASRGGCNMQIDSRSFPTVSLALFPIIFAQSHLLGVPDYQPWEEFIPQPMFLRTRLQLLQSKSQLFEAHDHTIVGS